VNTLESFAHTSRGAPLGRDDICGHDSGVTERELSGVSRRATQAC
jgi:hypothetical protein